ncbi:putative arf gtpase activator protein [Eutypa lata UCREL1]|uniref:ADP-ribosylation factor GTPase-activating protein n=1 Tax=Eutypa lata (strain UCR-EL1) TaxID=1287681 RepID=M7TQ38_EUTLA|nr:putative arf gtpase activator protein [Eutypa lata UCREL1]
MGAVSSRPDDGAARTSITVAPNAFPATRVTATRASGDSGLVEFIQDPDPSPNAPGFLLKLANDDELLFTFTFVIRQEANGTVSDANINGLTYVYASTIREVENLVTREFHADPNLHKNANVDLVGDFTTGGSSSVSFDWTWKWKPPKAIEDRGGGWRSVCSFVEYDQRAHRLNTLATFSFWVASEDMTVSDDGPVFRATIKALEQKTGNMRTQMKKVLKKAEHVRSAQIEANDAFVSFVDALREASSTNANAVQPALDHYFDKIAREILHYQRQHASTLQKTIIDPISKLYVHDIKQAEGKKRDFEEESKDYYAYVSRYLGQRSDSVKTKKLADSDTKYQTKRRYFELKRFDYSSFMQDLHGGRKEQEVLSHLTKYADSQARGFLATAKKVEDLLPELEALSNEVQDADKEFQYQRLEREEKRRVLEKSTLSYNEPESVTSTPNFSTSINANGNQPPSDSELGRADSTGSQLRAVQTGNSGSMATAGADLSRSPGSIIGQGPLVSPAQNSKFKGIRDLEERDLLQAANAEKNSTHRKEGLLWALNRPGSHVDPLSLNKQGWHKFWVVLDGGKLSEYSNWKQKLDLHMDPIDLRMASVREARNAERRFCFEVITPHFKRTLRENDQGNTWCADCGSNSKVEWVSINLAIILCIECSGIHRSLGTHISKVRSLTLDITSFTTDIIELLLLVGNRIANMVWEARLDPNLKPGPQATREQRLKFITAKYVDKAYVEPISATLSRYPTSDETLLAAIKRNEVQQVIYALALKANPNAHDKSRGTPALYLALAAVDPAPPSPSGLPTGRADPEPRHVPFPIAELLMQNGAEIPTTAPPFPLGRHAQSYLDQKRGRHAAVEATGSSLTSNLSHSPSERLQRDKDRLQKRISAGGRLAKSPIPER